MAVGTREYWIQIKKMADGYGTVVLRDPATTPVDVDPADPATVSARVYIANIRGQGFNGNNTDGGWSPSAISGATNATPIVITHAATAAALDIAAGDYVYIYGVLGNLNANGTFEVTSVSGSTTTLKATDGSGAYTSGGYITKLNAGQNIREAINAATVALLNDISKNG